MSVRRFRLAAGVLSALAVTGACSSEGTPGVRTDALQADIVFGVDLPEQDEVSVSPVDIPIGELSVEPAGLTTLAVPRLEPFQNRIPARFRDVPFTISPDQAAAVECPRAPLGSAPSETAPDRPANLPKEGVYRYKISGTRKFTYSNGATMQVPVSGFQPRIVRNVEQPSATRWTYETVQPGGDGGVIVSRWSVNAAAQQRSAKPPYVGENAVRVSEPDGGLSLTSIQYYDGLGNDTEAFNPVTPVTYLPFPVLEGQEFSSVGVDARGAAQRVSGQALKQQTVDACGTLLDGWLVELDITDSRGAGVASANRREEIVVGTTVGALITSQRAVETFVAPDGTTVESDVTFSIGQLEPNPLPAEDA